MTRQDVIDALEVERVLLHPRWELSRGRAVGPGPTAAWMEQEKRGQIDDDEGDDT